MKKLLAAAAFAAMSFAAPAQAAVVTQTYEFTAGGFQMLPGEVASIVPNDTFSGSFTLTYDDEVQVFSQNEGRGLLVDSFTSNLPFAVGPVYFLYSPSLNALTLGANGYAGSQSHQTNDFTLHLFVDASGVVTSNFAPFAQVSREGVFGIRKASNFSVTAVTGAVPEPGTWAMMLLGFGAIGASMRRRRRVSAIAQIA